MPNFFGDTQPTLYAGSLSFQLPVPDKEGKEQRFEKVKRTWNDFDGVFNEVVEGFQLYCNFTWSEITASDYDSLINILNSSEDKYIKFSTLPRKYGVIITDMPPGLEYGYDDGDSLYLELQGRHVLAKHPSLDAAFVIVPPAGRILNV